MNSFCCSWIHMLWVYGHYKYFIYFSTGIDYWRRWRLNTVPALSKGLMMRQIYYSEWAIQMTVGAALWKSMWFVVIFFTFFLVYSFENLNLNLYSLASTKGRKWLIYHVLNQNAAIIWKTKEDNLIWALCLVRTDLSLKGCAGLLFFYLYKSYK